MHGKTELNRLIVSNLINKEEGKTSFFLNNLKKKI
jgi:hypothetical protein